MLFSLVVTNHEAVTERKRTEDTNKVNLKTLLKKLELISASVMIV